EYNQGQDNYNAVVREIDGTDGCCGDDSQVFGSCSASSANLDVCSNINCNPSGGCSGTPLSPENICTDNPHQTITCANFDNADPEEPDCEIANGCTWNDQTSTCVDSRPGGFEGCSSYVGEEEMDFCGRLGCTVVPVSCSRYRTEWQCNEHECSGGWNGECKGNNPSQNVGESADFGKYTVDGRDNYCTFDNNRFTWSEEPDLNQNTCESSEPLIQGLCTEVGDTDCWAELGINRNGAIEGCCGDDPDSDERWCTAPPGELSGACYDGSYVEDGDINGLVCNCRRIGTKDRLGDNIDWWLDDTLGCCGDDGNILSDAEEKFTDLSNFRLNRVDPQATLVTSGNFVINEGSLHYNSQDGWNEFLRHSKLNLESGKTYISSFDYKCQPSTTGGCTTPGFIYTMFRTPDGNSLDSPRIDIPIDNCDGTTKHIEIPAFSPGLDNYYLIIGARNCLEVSIDNLEIIDLTNYDSGKISGTGMCMDCDNENCPNNLQDWKKLEATEPSLAWKIIERQSLDIMSNTENWFTCDGDHIGDNIDNPIVEPDDSPGSPGNTDNEGEASSEGTVFLSAGTTIIEETTTAVPTDLGPQAAGVIVSENPSPSTLGDRFQCASLESHKYIECCGGDSRGCKLAPFPDRTRRAGEPLAVIKDFPCTAADDMDKNCLSQGYAWLYSDLS
ncbi:MAG: hypothetical protein QF535_13850, partial [Anaerolineales bacterium]|nr:hypothetical protein [Anaerolineales bacterium]